MSITQAGTYALGTHTVSRMGYGAMQLAGPGVFGPPKDPAAAAAVLRAALAAGVDHVDTSDYYGPHFTNELIRATLYPYPANLTLVTKVGARRDAKGNWLPALSPADLEQAVHDNLTRLGLDTLHVVNLRLMGRIHGPAEGSLEQPFTALAELQRKGLIQHLGVSNVTATQIKQAQTIAPVVCVQNQYNIVHREDDALIDSLAAQSVAYVPFFPLGGFTKLQSDTLNAVATSLNATAQQTALAWLLGRAPNILLIPGTSSLVHLNENLAAARLKLPDTALETLNEIQDKAA